MKMKKLAVLFAAAAPTKGTVAGCLAGTSRSDNSDCSRLFRRAEGNGGRGRQGV